MGKHETRQSNGGFPLPYWSIIVIGIFGKYIMDLSYLGGTYE